VRSRFSLQKIKPVWVGFVCISLKDIDTSEALKIKIPYQQISNSELNKELPSPPQILLEILGTYSREDQQAIQRIYLLSTLLHLVAELNSHQ